MMDMPPGWTWVTLGEITHPTQQRVTPSRRDDRVFLGLEHVEPGTTKVLTPSSASGMKSATMLFEAGDTLYGRLRPYLNKVCMPNFGGLASSEFMVFKPSPLLVPGFLLYLLNSIEFVHFASLVNDGDRPRVKWNQISSFPVRLPPLNEQQRIVDEIDEQFSRLDSAERSLRRAEANLASLKLSAFIEAFAGDWPTQHLDEVTDSERVICYGILKPKTVGDCTVPYVEVRSIRDGRIDVANLNRTTEAMHQQFLRSELRPGDVVLAIRGSFDRAAVVPPELAGANVSRDVARIAPTAELDAAFLAHFLSGPAAYRYFSAQARGVAVKGVNIGDLRKMPIPFPSLDEQRQIVREVDRRLSVIDNMSREVEAARRTATSLRRAVLRDAFSGRLSASEHVLSSTEGLVTA